MDHPQKSNVDVEKIIRQSTQLRTSAGEARRLATLCDYCISIRLPPRKSEHPRAIYSRNLGEMNQAVKGQSTCAMCSFLMRQLGFLSESAKRNRDSFFSMRTTGYHRDSRYRTEVTQVYCKLVHNEIKTALAEYDVCKLAANPTADDIGVFVGKYPEPHPSKLHTRSGYGRYRPRIVNSDPLSEASIGLIKDWLSTCRNHSFCKEQKPRPLPTRVLDVRLQNPKIIEGDGISGFYVALSHCWGTSVDTFSTTTQNFEERKTLGIQLSQLPLNFRDAVATTIRLGYYYLWIDSLCILQQNVQDWRHEAGRMAGYYNNSVVTLVIADAMNCHDGFLQRRDHDHSPPILGDDGEFYCLRKELPGSYYVNASSCISKRAWTLQERILSPRVIHFTRDQVLWRCREIVWAEGYIFNSYLYPRDYMDRLGCLIDRQDCNPSWREKLPVSLRSHYFSGSYSIGWYDCVSDFSKRSLTQASDQLAAIAGLASRFSQLENVKYIAGLWDRDLFHGMTWRIYTRGESVEEWCRPYFASKADFNLANNLLQPPYRAPSWSWASVNGPVEWLHLELSGSEVELKEHWKMDFSPRLISCHLLHSSDNTYIDTLQGSWIEVRGFYRKLWVSKIKSFPEPDWPERLFIKQDPFYWLKGSYIKKVVLDIDPSQSETIYAYLSQPDQASKELLMLQLSLGIYMMVYGLVLEKIQEPNCFRRVGLVELQGYVFDHWAHGEVLNYSLLDKCDENCCPLMRKNLHKRATLYKSKGLQKDLWTEGTLKLF
jgi:hypothetical protein